MKTIVFPIIACAMSFGGMAAKPVTSGFVQVLGPGEVFSPIPEATGNVDASRLVDTPEVFTAAYAKDFEIDGDQKNDQSRNFADCYGAICCRSLRRTSRF